MQSRIILLSIILLLTIIVAEDRIAYVFEVARHGARSPLLEEPEGYFQVKKGQLTASGMRQRYLLGTYNRERYIDEYKVIDKEYNPNQLSIQSTKFPRVV